MEQKNLKLKKALRTVGLAILFLALAFGAGIGGEVFTKAYLSNTGYLRDLYFANNTDFSQKNIVINGVNKIVVNQEQMLNEVKGNIESSVVGIYRKKSPAKNAVDSIFLPSDYLGSAVVLTSDGWLLSAQSVGAATGDDVIVTNSGRTYEIDKIVKDFASGISFIKITVQNLSVVKFAEYKDLELGSSAIVYNSYSRQISLSSIKSLQYREINSKYDFISSSQVLDKSLLLNGDYVADYEGSPVFNFNGQAIGLLQGNNKIIPFSYVDPVVSDVLKGGEIKRPYLGVNYLDLSSVRGLSESQTQGLQYGALLWPDQTGKTIAVDSPLINLLDKGDIITAVEGEKIDAKNSLTDLLLEYKSGQQVKIKYYRENKEQELSVVLK